MSLNILLDIPNFSEENVPVLKEILDRIAKESLATRLVTTSPTSATLPGGELQIKDDDAGAVGVFLRTAKDNVVDLHARSSGCRVTLSGAQSIDNTTETKVTFDTEEWDTQGEFASNKFTATEAGKYQVNASGSMAVGDGKYLSVRIQVDGTTVRKALQYADGAEVITVTLSVILDLAAAEYVEMYVYHNQGGATNLDADTDHTYMEIQRII